jgi:hypothetical protein
MHCVELRQSATTRHPGKPTPRPPAKVAESARLLKVVAAYPDNRALSPISLA